MTSTVHLLSKTTTAATWSTWKLATLVVVGVLVVGGGVVGVVLLTGDSTPDASTAQSTVDEYGAGTPDASPATQLTGDSIGAGTPDASEGVAAVDEYGAGTPDASPANDLGGESIGAGTPDASTDQSTVDEYGAGTPDASPAWDLSIGARDAQQQTGGADDRSQDQKTKRPDYKSLAKQKANFTTCSLDEGRHDWQRKDGEVSVQLCKNTCDETYGCWGFNYNRPLKSSMRNQEGCYFMTMCRSLVHTDGSPVTLYFQTA